MKIIKPVIKTLLLLLILLSSLDSSGQIPGLTISKEKKMDSLYYRSKTVWFTLTPVVLVKREFSPDKGKSWEKVGMFGGNVRPYVRADSMGLQNINTYRLVRILGLTQMYVISPLLIYKHIQVSNEDPADQDIDSENNLYEEEQSGYLPTGILIYLTGAASYYLLSKTYLFRALECLNFPLDKNNPYGIQVKMGMNLDPIQYTPQLSLVIKF